MPIDVGDTLEGRYRVDALLGEGGMGAVYRATDLKLGVVVAVKERLGSPTGRRPRTTDPVAQAQGQKHREQFEREARVLARLRHSGLPKVTDHFIDETDCQYLVMEYVEGQDLQTLVKQAGRLSEERVAEIGIEVCGILEYLHGQDPPVIHRDIKPANLRVTPEGQVVLVDFGIAREATARSTTIGARGVSEGFSPLEQYAGEGRTDQRSDVYSLGATLYSLLSGEAPPAPTDRVMGRAVPPLPQGPLPGGGRLGPILMRALELKPEDRWQTAGDLRSALVEAAPAAAPAATGAAGATTRSVDTASGGTTRLDTTSQVVHAIPAAAEEEPGEVPRRRRGAVGITVGSMSLLILGAIAIWQIDLARQRHENEIARLQVATEAAGIALRNQQEQASREKTRLEADRKEADTRYRREAEKRKQEEALRQQAAAREEAARLAAQQAEWDRQAEAERRRQAEAREAAAEEARQEAERLREEEAQRAEEEERQRELAERRERERREEEERRRQEEEEERRREEERNRPRQVAITIGNAGLSKGCNDFCKLWIDGRGGSPVQTPFRFDIVLAPGPHAYSVAVDRFCPSGPPASFSGSGTLYVTGDQCFSIVGDGNWLVIR